MPVDVPVPRIVTRTFPASFSIFQVNFNVRLTFPGLLERLADGRTQKNGFYRQLFQGNGQDGEVYFWRMTSIEHQDLLFFPDTVSPSEIPFLSTHSHTQLPGRILEFLDYLNRFHRRVTVPLPGDPHTKAVPLLVINPVFR